jgi:hypothetical protein
MKERMYTTSTMLAKLNLVNYEFYNIVDLLGIKPVKIGYNKVGNKYKLWRKSDLVIIEHYISRNGIQQEEW